MRIGINASGLVVPGATLDGYVDHAVAAEADGFSSWWMAQLGVPDALTTLGVVGRATDTIELGTAVVPTWFRHPLMLAAQALTTQEMAGGRLALGIGLAHQSSSEGTMRIPVAPAGRCPSASAWPTSPRSRGRCASRSCGRRGTCPTTCRCCSRRWPIGGST